MSAQTLCLYGLHKEFNFIKTVYMLFIPNLHYIYKVCSKPWLKMNTLSSYVPQAFYVAMYIYDEFCIKIHTLSG